MLKVNGLSSETDNIKKEALLLEAPENAEAHRLRNMMAPNNKDAEVLYKAGKIRSREELNATLIAKYKNTSLFREAEVINECVKFNLLFTPSRSFKGTLSLKLVKKVDEFLRANNLIVSEDQYANNIYLVGRPKFESKEKAAYESNIKYAQLADDEKDPLLFFAVEERGEQFYILIDGNTSYKNLLNVFKGYMFYSVASTRLVLSVGLFFLLQLIINFAIPLAPYQFSAWKYLTFLGCYFFGCLLNRFFYASDGDAPCDASTRETYKSNRVYFEKMHDYEPQSRFWHTAVFIGLAFITFWCIDHASLNVKLRAAESYTKVYTREHTMNEGELKAAKVSFDPAKEYTRTRTYYDVFTPGTVFYNKEKKQINESITTEK